MTRNSILTIPFCFVIFLILSCNLQKHQSSKSILIPDRTSEHAFSLDTFSTFPPEIDGCSCYFSNDSIEFNNGQYIYMNDYNKLSFLKINGQMTKFTQIEFKELDNSTTWSRSKSENYELVIEVKYDHPYGEETQIYIGKIQVTDKHGNSQTKSFYGLCGC